MDQCQENMSFSTIIQNSSMMTEDDTCKKILNEMASNFETSSNAKTKNLESGRKMFRQRCGIIYYILDGFQEPIRNLNINTMKEIWYQTEKYKFQIIQKSNQNELLQRILQHDLEYIEITKIIIVLSTQNQYDQIFENFGFLTNLLVIEKFNQLKKQNNIELFREDSIQSQLNIFLSQIIKSLKYLSLHLYFPILLEQLQQAIEYHLHILSIPLKTIFQTAFQSLENLADILSQFFKLSFPFKKQVENKLTQEHFNYFQVLIRELIAYIYFPKIISPNDLYYLVDLILRQMIPDYQGSI